MSVYFHCYGNGMALCSNYMCAVQKLGRGETKINIQADRAG